MRPPEITRNVPHDGRTTVEEGGSVQLSCSAKGNPIPKIKWKRSDGKHMNIRGKNGENYRSKSMNHAIS